MAANFLANQQVPPNLIIFILFSPLTMHFLSTVLIALSATTVLSAPAPQDGGDAVQSNAAIKSIALNGSGCPAGSWTTTYSGDLSTISAVFSQFTPDATQSFRQNCQATIEVTIPAGKKFTVDGVSYNGFVQLESKTTVTHGATAYFQAQIDQSTASATLKGPINGKSVDLSNSFSNAVWSQCGATSAIVNIDISVYLDASGSADGFASVDDAKFGPFKLQNC
ncbi:hypothetical protein L218DRAFT_114584 [Marasmius fiardii PR-910]|nr:hypothetical protein L218DRAFT_114584 [Marasmius fiardii PR-910]